MARDLAKPGCDILRTFKELSPHTRPLGLFPSANSQPKREAVPPGCCQRGLRLNGEETGLKKNPARTVGFGQETNRAQEKQLQLSEGLFHCQRDNLPAFFLFSSPFFLFFFPQSLLPDTIPSQAAALAPSTILEHPNHASAVQSCSSGHRQREGLRLALLHPNHKPLLSSLGLARRMRPRARPWRYFAAIGAASPSPAFFFLLCPRQQ